MPFSFQCKVNSTSSPCGSGSRRTVSKCAGSANQSRSCSVTSSRPPTSNRQLGTVASSTTSSVNSSVVTSAVSIACKKASMMFVVLSIASAFDVGEFRGHFAVANSEDVNAADVTAVPRVAPTLHDSVVAPEGLLRIELRSVVREDVTPGTADGVASYMAGAIRRGTGCVEDAVIGDEVQSGVKVVRSPGLAESFDDGQGIAHVFHPQWVVARTLTYVQVSVKSQDATADRILDVAERLVQTRGFHGFSYADVATELGVT